MISCAVMSVRHAALNAGTSNSPSSLTNFIRFSDARLHAESSRNMYSEHGLLALIRDVLMHGCQSLIVVSYCMPGSPQIQAASDILRISARALWVSTGLPLVTDLVCHSPSLSTEFMKSSVTR